MPLALLALTISAFGTTEFVIVGLIPTIATDLGVSVLSAGLLVSLYALGVAGGAWAGALVVDHVGLAHMPRIAALVTLAAFGLTALSGRLDRCALAGQPTAA